MIAEVEYSINFTKQGNKFCLSPHYNRRYSYFFVNGLKAYQFKAKDFEITGYPPWLENFSKDFSNDNMKHTRLNGHV